MCATAEWPLHLAEMDGGPAHGLLHHGADSESSGPQRWLTHSSAGADPVPLGSGSDFRCSTGWSDEPLQWAVRRPTGPPPGAAAAAGRELPPGPAAARATAQPACQGRRRRLSRCTFPLDRPVSPPQRTVSCRYAMLTGAVAFCWESWEGGWAREEPWAGFGCAAAWPWRCSRPGLSQPAPLISWKTMVLVGRSQPAHEPEPSTRFTTVRHAAVSAAGLNDGAQCTTSPFGPSHLHAWGLETGRFVSRFEPQPSYTRVCGHSTVYLSCAELWLGRSCAAGRTTASRTIEL